MKLQLRFLLQILIPALFFGLAAYAHPGSQGTSISISVVKSDNAKPLADALVKITTLNKAENATKDVSGFTDSKGNFGYAFVQPVIVQVSQLGYYTVTDTIYIPENKIYALVIKSEKINDVVVTGQYKPESAQKSVYDVKVIDAEAIRAKGANNLYEALSNELNIDFGQDAVFGSNIGINGISGEGVKIMVDGVPLLGRLNGSVDLSSININNVERIEIVEGPLSVMYGTDAMGGVINIITKSHQAQKININLKGYYESVGQYNAEVDAGFAYKKNQFFLSAGRNFFGGYSPVDTPRFKLWKPREQYFADAKYVYAADRFRLTLSGSFFRELMIDRGPPVKSLATGDTSWTYVGVDEHYLTYRGRAAAAFMYRFKGAGQLDALAAYSGYTRFTNTYQKNLITLDEIPLNDPSDSVGQDTTRYHQIEVRATYTLSAWKNRLNFLFGVDVNQEYAADNFIQGGKQQLGDYATFGSARITIFEGFDIQPAVRFSYNTRFQVPLIPSFNIRYNYKDKLSVRASYGRGFRAPSINELFLTLVDVNHNLHGSPSLKPEDGNTVNASITYTKPIKKHILSFTASGFYNNIKNEITWRHIGSGTGVDYQYDNLTRCITFGGRAIITYRWQDFHAEASVQATRYQVDSLVYNYNLRMWTPDVVFNAGYMIPKILVGVNVTYKYYGLTPAFAANSGETGTVNPYNILSASITRNFWKDRIQLTVGGKNLLNVRNVLTNGVTGVGHNIGDNDMGWGRTFFMTLVFNYSK